MARVAERTVVEEPPAFVRRCRCGTEVSGEVYPCWACSFGERQAGFYREHRGARLSDFDLAVAASAEWLLDGGRAIRGLFVCGPTGTGKTRLLAAIAAMCDDARFGLARALIRATWNPDTQDTRIREMCRAPILLLDDLGREGRPTESVLATLHEIISERNGNYLPTAITSNYTLEQLSERYDEAIADRLRPWRKVVMAGRSKR